MKKTVLSFLLCIASIVNAQTLTEQLSQIKDAKLNIKEAIASKSIDMTNLSFIDYHLAIASITVVEPTSGNATVEDVLNGKTFGNDLEITNTGIMPNNNAITIKPIISTQTIPLGYHNGDGIILPIETIQSNTLASGVEILGVTGTLEQYSPFPGMEYDISEVELATSGIKGDWFMAESHITEIGQALIASALDEAPTGATCVGMSLDGKYLAVSSMIAPFLSTYKWNELNNRYETTAARDVIPPNSATSLGITNDGQYLVVGTIVSPYLRTYKWNESNNRYEATVTHDVNPPTAVSGLAVSSDGEYLIAGCNYSPSLFTYKWNETNNRYESITLVDTIPSAGILRAAFSNDKQYLAITYGATPYIITYKWNMANGLYEATDTPSYSPNECIGVSLSHNGKYMTATQYYSPYLATFIWNESNNRYEATTIQDANPTGVSRGVSLSADGQYLAIAHEVSPFLSTYKWNESNNRYEKTIAQDVDPSNNAGTTTMTFDGRRLVVGHGDSPYISTYNVPTIESLLPAIPMASNTIPLLTQTFGVLSESGSASDTVDLISIWKRN